MTTHQDGDLCFECDDCGLYKEFPFGSDFTAAWDELKQAGWRCTKEKGKWQHHCPSCVIDWARDQPSKRRNRYNPQS